MQLISPPGPPSAWKKKGVGRGNWEEAAEHVQCTLYSQVVSLLSDLEWELASLVATHTRARREKGSGGRGGGGEAVEPVCTSFIFIGQGEEGKR